MARGHTGKWNDYPCDVKFMFICKIRGNNTDTAGGGGRKEVTLR